MFKWVEKNLKSIIMNIALAALISILLINYVISAYQVDGDSMNLILQNNDRVIVSKLKTGSHAVNRFDVAVIVNPADETHTMIKRVIGFSGERISICSGELRINDKQFPNACLSLLKADKGASFSEVQVPENHIFVLGDNLPVSRDSRYFGAVPVKCVVGKVLFRYWPPAKIGWIE
jgi:signal peptidase I